MAPGPLGHVSQGGALSRKGDLRDVGRPGSLLYGVGVLKSDRATMQSEVKPALG